MGLPHPLPATHNHKRLATHPTCSAQSALGIRFFPLGEGKKIHREPAKWLFLIFWALAVVKAIVSGLAPIFLMGVRHFWCHYLSFSCTVNFRINRIASFWRYRYTKARHRVPEVVYVTVHLTILPQSDTDHLTLYRVTSVIFHVW